MEAPYVNTKISSKETNLLARSNKKIKMDDATILYDSFTHIYLVFCLFSIYKMSWYSLFYILKALLDVRLKKSKLKIIDRFNIRSISCAELEL
jgi:hypothetical protein